MPGAVGLDRDVERAPHFVGGFLSEIDPLRRVPSRLERRTSRPLGSRSDPRTSQSSRATISCNGSCARRASASASSWTRWATPSPGSCRVPGRSCRQIPVPVVADDTGRPEIRRRPDPRATETGDARSAAPGREVVYHVVREGPPRSGLEALRAPQDVVTTRNAREHWVSSKSTDPGAYRQDGRAATDGEAHRPHGTGRILHGGRARPRRIRAP